ncbi:MAG: TIGR04283 family arsenosugar biosynthesis glycosyltransferase [Nitrospira sp.]|nr:TIGR04283 family arsenosugar biosynthesis glycosyltransferase [Nitrospira sp.]
MGTGCPDIFAGLVFGMISVIMPAYNEEKVLPGTLQALFAQPGEFETILVDGGSTDRTRTIAESFGFADRTGDDGWSSLVPHRSLDSPRYRLHASHIVLTAPKGRASQMNAGAKQARGEWLLFLHADTVLPDGALQRLNDMERDQTVQAGGFMHRFSGDDWRLKFISFLDNFRCTRSRIIYGDQALFVRRTLFEQLGGFPKQPILEDVAFCERVIQVTNPLLLSPPVVTDARKFVKMGIWRSFVRVLLIILHVEYRLPVLPRMFFQDVR